MTYKLRGVNRLPTAEVTDLGDTVLCNDNTFVYGVFDSGGGMHNGETAASIARDAVYTYYADQNYAEEEDESIPQVNPANPDICAKKALEFADQRVRAWSRYLGDIAVVSTASIIQILPNGTAAYAHVGNSRIYRVEHHPVGRVMAYFGVEASNRIRRITQDEMSDAGGITNLLGFGRRTKVKQYGIIDLQKDNRLLLTTDGFTGPPRREPVPDTRIADALADSQVFSIELAMNQLSFLSNYTDDKAAVIVDVY